MHEHISTATDFDNDFQIGLKEARNYLSQLTEPLSIDQVQEVHGRLYGEIYASSGEFKDGFEPQDFSMLKKQDLDFLNPNLDREDQLHVISVQHVELANQEAFEYGNEEVANLITEHRMELAFGERQWQGLDEIDAQNWDRAVERGEVETVAGFLENQLQDAIDYEQNPLQEFQQTAPDTDSPDLTRKERKIATKQELEDKAKMGELEEIANQKIEEHQKENQEPVDLSQSSFPEEDSKSQEQAKQEAALKKKAQEMLARLERNRDDKSHDHDQDL